METHILIERNKHTLKSLKLEKPNKNSITNICNDIFFSPNNTIPRHAFTTSNERNKNK